MVGGSGSRVVRSTKDVNEYIIIPVVQLPLFITILAMPPLLGPSNCQVKVAQPALEKGNYAMHEEQPNAPSGCPETTTRALPTGPVLKR